MKVWIELNKILDEVKSNTEKLGWTHTFHGCNTEEFYSYIRGEVDSIEDKVVWEASIRDKNGFWVEGRKDRVLVAYDSTPKKAVRKLRRLWNSV